MAHDPTTGANVAPASLTHKTCSKCGESKLLSEFHKAKKSRDGLNWHCKQCSNRNAQRWYADNTARAKQSRQQWAHKNRTKSRALKKRYREGNSEKLRTAKLAYYAANPEKYTAWAATRRALKVQATPAWVDRAAIEEVYREAVRLTAETGIPHEVDHVIPLKHDLVCGLHVPWNLRAIPVAENRSKHNAFYPWR